LGFVRFLPLEKTLGAVSRTLEPAGAGYAIGIMTAISTEGSADRNAVPTWPVPGFAKTLENKGNRKVKPRKVVQKWFPILWAIVRKDTTGWGLRKKGKRLNCAILLAVSQPLGGLAHANMPP